MHTRLFVVLAVAFIVLAAQTPVGASTLSTGTAIAQRSGPNVPATSAVGPTSKVVAVGYSHSCAIRSDGLVVCWGDNTFNQQQNVPTSGTFTQVSVGQRHSCAIKTDDTLACWGENTSGYNQLTNIPTGTFKQLSAGANHTCAIRTDGTLACWGDNVNKQSEPPTGTFIEVGAGFGFTCAIRTNYTMACWGSAGASYSAAQPGTFKKVSADFTHGCAIRTNDTLMCWGDDNSGKATPPSGTFKDLDAAFSHNCAVRMDGTLACWGDSYTGRASPPGGTFTQVSSAYLHNCALSTEGVVVCWGYDASGQATPPNGGYGFTGNFHHATAWTLGGNTGTAFGSDYIGTNDNVPLVFKVNGARVLRLEPNATSPNILGGSSSNTLTTGVVGATLGGGGTAALPNAVTDNYGTVNGGAGNRAGNANTVTGDRVYGTVGGGFSNRAGGNYATVPGGATNEAIGSYSFAAGRGAQATADGTFVWADANTPKFPSTAANQFSVRATGGTRIVSAINGAGTPTGGVQLTPGAGSWSSLSDRNAKSNIVAVDGVAILDKLAAIPIALWNYNAQDASIKHIGPMAQDFAAAFGVGEDSTHIATVDADGVALAAIQGLNAKLDNRDATIDALEARIAALEASRSSAATVPTMPTFWLVALVVGGGLMLLLAGIVVGLTLRRRSVTVG